MRYELTDYEWAAIKPFLPNKPRGVPPVNDRRVLNGIFWVLRSGAALARIARELRPNLPVVYASGSYSKIEQLDAVSGAIFVPKPYDPDKLCEMLSEMAAH